MPENNHGQQFKRLTVSVVVKAEDADAVASELNQCLDLIGADHFIEDNGIVEKNARRPADFDEEAN